MRANKSNDHIKGHYAKKFGPKGLLEKNFCTEANGGFTAHQCHFKFTRT